MKLFYIGILTTEGKGVELAFAEDLSSFSIFQRPSVREFTKFFGSTIATRTEPGQRQSIEEGSNVGHVYARSEGLAGVLISDKEYPVRVAFALLNKVLDEYLATHPKSQWAGLSAATPATAFPPLEDYLRNYQDPRQADSIMRVQQELDDTKIVLHRTIESVLQRGEKLDTLVDKSEALSSTSRMFYKQAKKTNSCCIIC